MSEEIRQTPLGKRLRELRQQRGLSLQAVDEGTGISRSLLSKMETGRTAKPTQDNLNRLADFYDIEPEELWTLADYDISTRLPSFTPYLRSRYDLPPEALAELNDHFAYIRQKYETNTDTKRAEDNGTPHTT